jgi:hypothetical protein
MAENWIGRQRTTWERKLDLLGDFLTEDPSTSQTSGSDNGEQS